MTPLQAATRETFWTIGPVGKAAFYWLAAVAILVLLYGVYARFAAYARGSADPRDRLSDLPSRVVAATKTVLSNENQFDRDLYAGVMHTFVLWGFLTLLVATTILGFDIDVYRPLAGESFWVGDFYLAYQFTVDAFGLLFVVGVGMAMFRRYRNREGRLWGKHTSLEDDAFVWTLFALGVGGFVVQALGIVGQPGRGDGAGSFIGMAVAAGMEAAGLTAGGGGTVYRVVWVRHPVL